MATSTDPLPDIPTSLADDPAGNFHQWEKDIRNISAQLLADEYAYGLAHLVFPPAMFATLPRNTIVDADGDLVEEVPPNPVKPATLVANASGGTVAIFKDNNDRYLRFQKSCNAFRNAILKSLGATLRLELTDPASDIILLDVPTIVRNMEARFGTRTAANMSSLHYKLLQPIDGQDSETFRKFSSTFVDILNQLLRADYEVDEYSKMQKFSEATSMQPAISTAINDYVKLNPVLGTRNLPALISYVSAQLANLTLSNAGFAGSAATMPPTPLTTEAIVNAAVQSALALYSKSAPRESRPESGTGRNSLYCFHHGRIGHAGSTCRHMAAQNKVKKGSFTTAQIQAKDSSIGGHA